VTEVQATRFLQDAKTNGLTVTPTTEHSGVVTGYGAEISYRYDTAKQSLQLSLVKHPPLMGGVVWGQVEQRIPPGISRQI
jgi:hypothetical protein